MKVGSPEYQSKVHRWRVLYSMTTRTWEQQNEMESLNRALDAAEARWLKAQG